MPLHSTHRTARKRVADLVEGDLVDLEGDKYADPNRDHLYEYEYHGVLEIEPETADCICVYFDGADAIGFPPDHVVTVLIITPDSFLLNGGRQ